MRADQYVDAVLTKCANLRDCGMWAAEPKVRPAAWLQNFTDTEKPIAAALLDHFVFFSSVAVDAMLLSGFRALRDSAVRARGRNAATLLEHQAVFTPVEGEVPNTTDSGHLFCRKLRQILALPDSRFLDPDAAIERAAAGEPIVFLDDFVGSGDQFVSTWERQYRSSAPRSFREAHGAAPFPATYLALVGTADGCSRIGRKAPGVEVSVCHILSNLYGVHSLPRNALKPDGIDVAAGVEALLSTYDSRLQLPHYFDTQDLRKYGYGEYGLQIAFEHSTPDATLPIFWADGGARWTPLVRRS
jgi:hypothetical protein